MDSKSDNSFFQFKGYSTSILFQKKIQVCAQNSFPIWEKNALEEQVSKCEAEYEEQIWKIALCDYQIVVHNIIPVCLSN